jgi:hypothetical protein
MSASSATDEDIEDSMTNAGFMTLECFKITEED